MAQEQGLQVDREGFTRLMTEQRQRAKADAKSKKSGHAHTEVWRDLRALGETDFRAYSELTSEAKVVGLVVDGATVTEIEPGQRGQVVLDRTPFYAESGGQIADEGVITADGVHLKVVDVQRPVKGLIAHTVEVLTGPLRTGAPVLAEVDPEWRISACQAHSGTHVVHAALRQVLGPSALQSGSYNKPGYLRLDFAWGSALSAATRSEIEEVANLAVRQDLPGVGHLHAAAAGPRDRRARAVRRDLRRGRARRRDRWPVEPRAVRWHPRAALQPDRRPHGDR